MSPSTIVIKVGTNVITTNKGLLATAAMQRIVDQIALLRQQGHPVILVTSGAMGAGRALIRPAKKLDPVSARQVLAAVGQIPLVAAYSQLFTGYQMISAQVLATKEDFRDRTHYLNMQHCFQALLANSVVPVVNENDVVSIGELMFTDNDELASLVAAMVNADRLIILSSVDGVLDTAGKVIRTIDKVADYTAFIRPDKSQFGRGGMETKCRMAVHLARLGVTTHIINGHSPENIVRCLTGEAVGTTFIPRRSSPAIKRWLASARGHEQGVAVINACAVKVISDPTKAASILPVGIIRLEGTFKKGDVIKITDEKGVTLGYGRSEYNASDAQKIIGKKDHKEFIHYNYLFLDL